MAIFEILTIVVVQVYLSYINALNAKTLSASSLQREKVKAIFCMDRFSTAYDHCGYNSLFMDTYAVNIKLYRDSKVKRCIAIPILHLHLK